MSLTFYSCSDPPNKLNKTLISLGSTNYFKPIYANGETTTQYILDSGMPAGTNYIYDSDLRRYFFVVEVVHDIAKTITVNCVLDPLYTFRDKLGGTFYFVRGANEVNEMEDNNYPLSDYIRTETYNIDGWDNNFFKNSDGGYRFILKTAVGKATTQAIKTASVGDMIHHGIITYTIGASSGGYHREWICSYTSEAVPPSGISVDLDDVIELTEDGVVYNTYVEKIIENNIDPTKSYILLSLNG